MVEHIRWRGGENIQRAIHTTTEIRHQRFNLNVRAFLTDGGDAICKVLRTAVAEIVTVNGGNHHVTQCHVGNGLGQLQWLVGVRGDRATVCHVAERAATGANRAQNHEGGRTVVETFRKVRARRFFTDRVKAVLTHRRFDTLNA
ncbi:hypothetical protein D3C72_1883940 [compost metagenome]